MRNRWLAPLGLAAVLSAALVFAAAPAAALEIGVRGGYSDAGGEVFDGSGDVGSGGLFGAVAALPILPAIDLEIAYERYASEFDLDDPIDWQPLETGAEYVDQSFLATMKFHLFGGAGPVGIYGGAGASLHSIDLEFKGGVEPPDLEPDDNDYAWHAVAGIDVRLPEAPLLLYGEYRFQNIEGKEMPRFHSVYAGLNLVLE